MRSNNCEDSYKVENKIIADAESVGWSVVMVEATAYSPSFAYTIGLWRNYRHPEMIAFGLTTKTLHLTLNIAGEKVKDGTIYKPGEIYTDFFTSGTTQMLLVDKRNLKDYFGYAIWFNRETDFPALELIWTDRNGRFPWETGYEQEFKYRQPLLDRNAEFKFREERNLCVFTTRQLLEGKKEIVMVVHDEDGDWQFLTEDGQEDDIRLVSLEQMIRLDPTLNTLFDLNYGMVAERTHIGGGWTRSEVQYGE